MAAPVTLLFENFYSGMSISAKLPGVAAFIAATISGTCALMTLHRPLPIAEIAVGRYQHFKGLLASMSVRTLAHSEGIAFHLRGHLALTLGDG
jgi:hypothetical protein